MSDNTNTQDGGLLAKYHRDLQYEINKIGWVGPFLYRGHGGPGDEVASRALRRIRQGRISRGIDEKKVPLDTFIEYHKDLLTTVRLKGWHHSESGRELGILEQLAKLQHYGAATCLVDFTTSFDIALWFACSDESEKEEDGKVFFADINRRHREVNLWKIEEKELKPGIAVEQILNFETRQSDPNKIVDSLPRIWHWDPEGLIRRMASQGSQFLFCREGNIPNSILSHIKICQGHKADLLEELREKQNIRPESVFSDMFGFAGMHKLDADWEEKKAEEYLKEGEKEFSLGNFLSAIENFDRALQSELDNQAKYDAMYYRGRANSALTRYNDALLDFENARKIDSTNPMVYLQQAWVNHKLGLFEKVINDCNIAIELKPNNAVLTWAYNNRGAAIGQLGQTENAIQDYFEAIKFNPSYALAYTNLGAAIGIMAGAQDVVEGRHEEAMIYHNKAIELDPNLAMAYFNRGFANSQIEKHDLAIDDYTTAIRLDPHYALAYFNRGISKIQLGRNVDAIFDWDKAIELDPQLAGAYHSRGLANKRLELYDKAYVDIQYARDLYNEQKYQGFLENLEAVLEELRELMRKQ